MSLLSEKRLRYAPKIPDLLKNIRRVSFQKEATNIQKNELLRSSFPKTLDLPIYVLKRNDSLNRSPLAVGVLFSGGPAAGGHNVVWALWEGLKQLHSESCLIGFLGGIEGLLENKAIEISESKIAPFKNQGGFDLLGTGRGKLETDEQKEIAFYVCQQRQLDGLVIIGGDDSQTNGALLAEYFLEKGCKTSIIGVPKTIDGDLRSKEIEIPFGFDTACKTYSEMIGNIQRDALSARKYYHFIKLMGRSASHICLECALASHPNLALIGEERKSLQTIVQEITDLICARSKLGKDYGVILIPEGILEFIPEIHELITALGKAAPELLPEPHKTLFFGLPEKIQKQFLLGKDPHGNLLLSQINTEELLIEKVKQQLAVRKDFKGTLTAQNHFLGYEGRCSFPSNFDADCTYALGLSAALAVRDRLTAVICCLQQLRKTPDHWTVKAVPIHQLVHFEMRNNKKMAVVKKHLVDLKSQPFLQFSQARKSWKTEDLYEYPGPIQFFGDPLLTDAVPAVLLD